MGIERKYEQTVLNQETHFVRDGGLVIQDRNANNTVVNEYTRGLSLGGGIGGLLNLKQSGVNYAYLYDGSGNVEVVLNSVQTVVATYRYDPFGNLTAKTGTLNQPYMFSTKRYDPAFGIVFYEARPYLSAIVKWMTRDPLGEEGGLNLYAFVGNNPVNWVDPWGLSTLVFDRAAGRIYLDDSNGNEVGNWPAGTYQYAYHTPHPESGVNDAYGSYGNYVFSVPNRSGMGVHSGRANQNGPQHPTNGCIRTTDDATDQIGQTHAVDPLTVLIVSDGLINPRPGDLQCE
jgi:RHS repeat-associated protein